MMKNFLLAVAAAFAFFFSPAAAQAQSANCTVASPSDWGSASKERGTKNFAPTNAGDFSRKLADWAITDSGKQQGMNIPAACREAFVAAMTSQNGWTADTPWSAVGETVFFPRVMQVAAPTATAAPAPAAQAAPAATSNQEAQQAAEAAQRNVELVREAEAARLADLERREAALQAMPQTRQVQAELNGVRAAIAALEDRVAGLDRRLATLQASVTALAGRVTAVEGTANTALTTANAAQSAAAQAEAKADAAAKIANQALEANQGAATQADLNAVSLVGALAFGLLLLLIVGLVFWVRSLRAKIQDQPTAASAPGDELAWSVHPLRDAA